MTRIGKLELRVPRDRNGQFQTALFERHQRSERAFVAALAEMYGQGVSARKVKPITEALTESAWRRCTVRFLRNALGSLPRKADDDCLQALRWLYDRRDLDEAQRDLAAWLTKGSTKYPKLTNGVDDPSGETLTFYRPPRAHHKPLKFTNMRERLNEEIKRRTRVGRIFPNTESCLRLVRALCVETHEAWLEDNRTLNMELLQEQKKAWLRQAA